MWGNKAKNLPKGFVKIPGFSRYGINEKGEIYSLINARLKSIWINQKGYLEVGLQNNKSKTVFRTIHKLLMLTFKGERPKGFDICHNDGNKLNNSLNNLRYDTRKNNILDKESHGKKRVGIDVNTSKLTEQDVRYIRKNYFKIHRTKSNSRNLAKKFGVTKETIANVISGRSWKHIKFVREL